MDFKIIFLVVVYLLTIHLLCTRDCAIVFIYMISSWPLSWTCRQDDFCLAFISPSFGECTILFLWVIVFPPCLWLCPWWCCSQGFLLSSPPPLSLQHVQGGGHLIQAGLVTLSWELKLKQSLAWKRGTGRQACSICVLRMCPLASAATLQTPSSFHFQYSQQF